MLQVQADPVPVVGPVGDESGEAPLELLGDAGHAQRAAPDPPRRRARVLVRRRHEPRPELRLHGARQHARVHVERNLVLDVDSFALVLHVKASGEPSNIPAGCIGANTVFSIS